jgi:hypothetical protein
MMFVPQLCLLWSSRFQRVLHFLLTRSGHPGDAWYAARRLVVVMARADTIFIIFLMKQVTTGEL